MAEATTDPKVTISAVVLRCGCGQPEAHRDAPCPRGVEEDWGVIAEGED